MNNETMIECKCGDYDNFTPIKSEFTDYTDGISGYVCNSCNAEYVRRPKWVPHKWIMILEFAGYAEERMTAEVQGKPAMWFNKSVFRAYHAGIASADKNGNYEWVYGATEHCEDCKRAENGRNRRN